MFAGRWGLDLPYGLIRQGFLLLAILLYGIGGSPTPDNPGLIEAALGLCLIMAMGVAGIVSSVRPSGKADVDLLKILFLYGMSVPFLSAMIEGTAPALILRDAAAFLFVCLPLFFTGPVWNNARMARCLPVILTMAGIFFSLRTLMPAFNVWIPADELLYLSNSPLVIFTAVYLPGQAWMGLMQGVTLKNCAKAALLIVLTGVVLGAMLLDVQRATVGAAVLSGVMLAAWTLFKTPRRAAFPLLVFGGLALSLYYPLMTIWGALARKTVDVGINARFDEARAVYETASSSWHSFLFGKGWGVLFSDPAVAGIEVNYTHSFLTYLFLKGGIVAVALAVAFLAALLYKIVRKLPSDPVTGLALCAAIAIPVFLYASHKSLDFGLILLMAGIWVGAGSGGFLSPASSPPTRAKIASGGPVM